VSTLPLAVSLGDPAGVGPEIIVKAWRAQRGDGPSFFVVGDAGALASAWGEGLPAIQVISRPVEAEGVFGNALPVLNLPLARVATPGAADPAAAAAIIAWIETAAGFVLSGEAAGLVTAPIAKAALYAAGFAFPGHTEFLGALAPPAETDARGPVMMLTAQDLKVTLVTIHEPIAQVPDLLTQDRIFNAGLVTARALTRDFGVRQPRVAVTGLNPHAGEDGALGREEIETIAPAITRLRALGVRVTGPHPADSLFHAEARRSYDAVLCMYHDQALIPVKMLDFWGGVNVTLGLPIIRTSPDHGVAFDIAGKGRARPESLIAAIRLAAEMAVRRAGG
jgi:4-hydroxythreonine-4-phosphate dehydrogenase